MSEELLVMARRMSADLQDFADAARESGSPVKETEALLKEFDEWHSKNTSWQETLFTPDNDEVTEFLEIPKFLRTKSAESNE